jgi:hypothetical protein
MHARYTSFTVECGTAGGRMSQKLGFTPTTPPPRPASAAPLARLR